MIKKFDPTPFISQVGKQREERAKEHQKLRASFDRSAYQSAFKDQGTDDYQKVACKALGIPYDLDPKKIYHHLGNIDASTSPEAIRAIIYASKDWTVYTYMEYLDAIKRIGKIQGQLDAIEKHRQREDERWTQHQDKLNTWRDSEKGGAGPSFYEHREPEPPSERDENFLGGYHMESYTPDVEGYRNYILMSSSEIYGAINKPIPFYLEENPNKPHGYVLGTSGSGKSELLKILIHTYVTNKHYGSVVVIDPTSDFVKQIAKWQEFNTSDRLIYIRPTLIKGKIPCVNPFEIHGVSATDYSEEALNIKRVIAQELVEALNHIVTGGGGNLTPPMEGILTNCVLVLLDKEGATLEDLGNFMNNEENGDLIAYAKTLKHHEYIVKYFTKENGFKGKGNFQTKEAIGRRLDNLLSVGIFKKLTCGKSTFHLEDALENKKVILFDLGKGAIGKGEGSAFGRLVMAMLFGIANRRESLPKNKRIPCSIVIDECHNFVSTSMEDILTEARKYRMYLTMAQQTAGQRMLPQLKDIVLETTSLQVVGGTSRSGAKRNADIVGVTASDIEKLEIGEFYVRAHRAGSPLKFKARDDLINWNNCVTKETWKRVLRSQMQYYTHPISPAEQDEEPTEDVGWDY